MKQLSAIDTLFLLMEQRQQPLHVGALCLYEPPPGAPPEFALNLAERMRESTAAARPFNRRLVSRAGLKFWQEDTNFDLAHHFVHLALPKPGRIRELLAMVSRVHSAHLDRAYPLWRTYLIEGLEDGRIATYSKIHHSLVDGVAGIRLMLKSMSPDVAASLEMPAPWEVRTRKTRERTLPVPTGTTMFRARGSTPFFTVTARASVATKGSAPSRRTLPSSRTRRSATAMGPNSSAVTAMIRETTSVRSP